MPRSRFSLTVIVGYHDVDRSSSMGWSDRRNMGGVNPDNARRWRTPNGHTERTPSNKIRTDN